jgi:hypothetical protein
LPTISRSTTPYGPNSKGGARGHHHPPPTRDQQIAEITQQAEAAVAQALANPGSDRTALAERLEAVAQEAEEGEAQGSPYLALAAQLRALAARLDALPTDQQQNT